MNTIKKNTIETAYDLGKKIHKGELSLKNGTQILVDMGMSDKTASIALKLYGQLRDGKEITRAHSIEAADYYLNRIYQENGLSALEIAIKAMTWHLDYYERTVANAKGRRIVLEKYLKLINEIEFEYAEEVEGTQAYIEGKVKTIQVNAIERNYTARKECLKIHGFDCIVCGFDFEQVYGEIGKEYIHVHHKIDIAKIGKEYVVNPETDLIPVCPNCHAMLHTEKPAMDYRILIEKYSKSKYNGQGYNQ